MWVPVALTPAMTLAGVAGIFSAGRRRRPCPRPRPSSSNSLQGQYLHLRGMGSAPAACTAHRSLQRGDGAADLRPSPLRSGGGHGPAGLGAPPGEFTRGHDSRLGGAAVSRLRRHGAVAGLGRGDEGRGYRSVRETRGGSVLQAQAGADRPGLPGPVVGPRRRSPGPRVRGPRPAAGRATGRRLPPRWPARRPRDMAWFARRVGRDCAGVFRKLVRQPLA